MVPNVRDHLSSTLQGGLFFSKMWMFRRVCTEEEVVRARCVSASRKARIAAMMLHILLPPDSLPFP
eukprot:5289608-Pleurochrysis_carterae.AAC.2